MMLEIYKQITRIKNAKLLTSCFTMAACLSYSNRSYLSTSALLGISGKERHMVTAPHVFYYKNKLTILYNSLHDYSHLSNHYAEPCNHCIKTMLHFIRNQVNKEHLASSERTDFTLSISLSYIYLKIFENSALRKKKI